MTCQRRRESFLAGRARVWAAEEADWGVYNPAIDLTPVRIPIISETLQDSRIGPGALHGVEAGASASHSGRLGRSDVGGEIITQWCVNGWGPLLFRHAVGGDVATGAGPGGLYTHSGSVGALPVGLSIDKAFPSRSGDWLVRRLLGMRVNRFTMRSTLQRGIEVRASMLGRQALTIPAPVSVERYYGGDLIVPSNVGTVHLDRDGDEDLEAVGTIVGTEWTIENTIGRGYGPESGTLPDGSRQGRRYISGRVEANFSPGDIDLLDRWLADDRIGFRIVGTHPQQHEDAAYEFEFPRIIIRGNPEPKAAGEGAARLDFTFEAVFDDDAESEMLWSITNQESAISTGAVTRVA